MNQKHYVKVTIKNNKTGSPMDFEKTQLDLYKEIRANGLYNQNRTTEILSLIRSKGYLEYSHNTLVSQLENLTIDNLYYDKISVVIPASVAATNLVMEKFHTHFHVDSTKLYFTTFNSSGFNKKYFEHMLKIVWIPEEINVRIYFLQTDKKLSTNIKVDFNLTKSREQALEVFRFIHENLPPTRATQSLYKARITRLERYFILNNIPVWTLLTSRWQNIKKRPSYFASESNNGITSGYYISKDNSKEIVVYDKYASENRYSAEEYIEKNEDDKQKSSVIDSKRLANNNQFTVDCKNPVKIETKFEVRNFKNKMNKESRKRNLFFYASSTFPYFLNTTEIYSPQVFNELTDEECLYIIKHGFYNFIVKEREQKFSAKERTIKEYKINFEKKYRKNIEVNLQILFDSFLADLSQLINIKILNSGKAFEKRRRRKNKFKS